MVDVRKETTFFYLQAFDATRPNQALLWYSSDAQCMNSEAHWLCWIDGKRL